MQKDIISHNVNQYRRIVRRTRSASYEHQTKTQINTILVKHRTYGSWDLLLQQSYKMLKIMKDISG